MAVAVVLGLLALPGAASATTYCSGSYIQLPCDATQPTFQAALDAASLHSGADVVRLGIEDFTSPGFVYDDRGSATNAVTIEGTSYCSHDGPCGNTTLKGATSGGKQLSFTGGGGAPVTVSHIELDPGAGATGLELPAGAHATNVDVLGLGDGIVGVRLAGAGALLEQSRVFGATRGGATDVGVDAAAGALVDRTDLHTDLGIRSESPGLLQVTGGAFTTGTGIRANHARIAGAILDASEGPAVEAICPNPAAPDSDVSVTNATAYGTTAAGVGMRAVASDGGGQSCAANLSVNSSTITGVTTALLAHGEGAAAAHIDASYSNFDPAKVVTEGPATVNSASPGGNVNVDPLFIPIDPPPRSVDVFFSQIKWPSRLIDAGDPAALEPWQQGVLSVVHGRRDIGADEYGFAAPDGWVAGSPQKVGPGAPVSFIWSVFDADLFDTLTATWHFDAGPGSTSRGVNVDGRASQSFERLGPHGLTVTVEDPTGLRWSEVGEVEVVRPQVVSFGLSRSRLRPGKRILASCGLTVPARVRFTVQRRVRRHGRSLWKLVPGRRSVIAAQSIPDVRARLRFGVKWGARRLHPGLFRLTATPAQGQPARARFRIYPRKA